MPITPDTLRKHHVIDNGCREFPHDPVCPMIQQAIGRSVHCDDPACSQRNFCSFRDHPRGRAKWREMADPLLGNWSA